MSKDKPDISNDKEHAARMVGSNVPTNQPHSFTSTPTSRSPICSGRGGSITITCGMDRLVFTKLRHLSEDLDMPRQALIEEAILDLWRKHKC